LVATEPRSVAGPGFRKKREPTVGGINNTRGKGLLGDPAKTKGPRERKSTSEKAKKLTCHKSKGNQEKGKNNHDRKKQLRGKKSREFTWGAVPPRWGVNS